MVEGREGGRARAGREGDGSEWEDEEELGRKRKQ